MAEQSQRVPRFPAWTVRRRDRAERLREMLETQFSKFPWAILIHDWTGAKYAIGGEQEHWCGEPLTITIKSDRAGARLLSLDAFRFLESFLEGDVDLDGNWLLEGRHQLRLDRYSGTSGIRASAVPMMDSVM